MKAAIESAPLTPKESAALCELDDTPRLRVVTAQDLLAYQFPPPGYLVNPIIPKQGIVEVYSKRGVGKTFFTLGLALHAAAGANFLNLKIDRATRVLYVDSEMSGGPMQARIASIIQGMDADLEPDNFRLITPDLQSMGIPSLSTPHGQAAVESELEDTELLILDNLSTLCRDGKENEGESWLPMQGWLLDLRRRGIATLFVHHAGKGGAQRGTSRKENILDIVVVLRHPSDYSPEEGARFEIHYEKARGNFGDAVAPIEVTMRTENGACVWLTKELKDVMESKVRNMIADGMSLRDIAEETGLSRSTIHRMKNRFERAK